MRFIYIVSVFILFSCVSTNNTERAEKYALLSMQEQHSFGHWFSFPSDNMITVIGVSNRMRTRDAEITAAKEDAAQKISMFHGIEGNIETMTSTGSNIMDFAHIPTTELKYNLDFNQYIDKLIFDPEQDVFIANEAVYVRFRYAAEASSLNYFPSINNHRPIWTNNRDLPRFDNYHVAVGYSQNQRYFRDTVLRAVQNAVVQMINNLYSSLETLEVDNQGQGAVSTTRSVSSGKLNNFQVIEYWIDPQTRAVWTLAIAKKD